ncbi:MAG: ribbon-helix-helix protein, CopG family [Acidimicrobiaceae bacterium]|nr:ribbon-helix-helix protein, CopG family [Acidimicrobiaceae bacterium]
MTDILIRGVPEEVVAEIDIKAAKAGVSRAEYLRRVLAREQANSRKQVAISSLAEFAETFSDLESPDVMGNAWS